MDKKSISDKITSLEKRIGVQIFVVTDAMTEGEKESANIWNPILKSWIETLQDIQKDIG